MTADSWTVREVADLSGTTVRTLHHYDDLGLVPARRSAVGYRLYGPAELERLQEVLFFRACGLPLAEIADVVGAPGYARADALRTQLDRVEDETRRLAQVRAAITAALAAHEEGTPMTDTDASRRAMFSVFDDVAPAEHDDRAAEAETDWGDTDAWRQSQRRTSTYGQEQWQAIKDEAAAINADMAALLAAGEPADGPQAMDVAERARQHITRWFYDCAPQMHAAIAASYVSDDRFARTYENVAVGLAQYTRDAVVANAERRA